jgi:DhnA family fructose-bisphosphate aldolase class Ia
MKHNLYRLQELFNPGDNRSLVVDTSSGISLGVQPGLELFSEAIRPLLPLLDGIVTSPGQAGNLGVRTRKDAALIVCADWTNALRGKNFILPPETIQYVPLLKAADAVDLGATALVTHLILGHEEEIEAHCLQNLVGLALEGKRLGMPLLADVQPIGPRVVSLNKAIELGVSYALEGGAEGVIIPYPGTQSFETIQTMCAGFPVWVKHNNTNADNPDLEEALQLGAAGFWLDERIFANAEPAATLHPFEIMVHPPVDR